MQWKSVNIDRYLVSLTRNRVQYQEQYLHDCKIFEGSNAQIENITLN